MGMNMFAACLRYVAIHAELSSDFNRFDGKHRFGIEATARQPLAVPAMACKCSQRLALDLETDLAT
jgi:hypothetical protein